MSPDPFFHVRDTESDPRWGLTPFTVAGFALVYLLLKCNLTVHLLCSSKCFPTGDNTAAMHILSTFTAWPNLDL